MNFPHIHLDSALALLGLGANLGDCQETLRQAWEEIGILHAVKTVQLSPFYETLPQGGPANQPPFWNAAGVIQTTLPPEKLLEHLQEIENRHGRVRTVHWGPRTLDLDILLYGTAIIQTANLTIPHIEMLNRRFVLEPACDIAPDMIHPLSGKTVREHWLNLEPGDVSHRNCSPDNNPPPSFSSKPGIPVDCREEH